MLLGAKLHGMLAVHGLRLRGFRMSMAAVAAPNVRCASAVVLCSGREQLKQSALHVACCTTSSLCTVRPEV